MTTQNTKTHIDRSLRDSVSRRLVVALGMLFFALSPAHASNPNKPAGGNYTSIAAAPQGGFWVQVDDGARTGTYAIDGAEQFASVPEAGSIAAYSLGYWVVSLTGQIYNRGSVPELCGGSLRNCSGYSANPGNPIVAAAANPVNSGLWAVDREGHVWTAGEAVSYGDVSFDPHPPSGIVATPTGNGYYIALTDGGVYAFGDAQFYGSFGGNPPGGHDITGIAISRDRFGKVNGYWLVGSDGGVFAFGDAPFLGSTGGAPGRNAVSNIVVRPNRRTYAWVHWDGRVELSRNIPVVQLAFAKEPNTALDTPSHEVGAHLLIGAAEVNDITQEWDMFPATADGSVVQLISVYSGLCADAEANAPNATIIQWPCKGENDGWNNQRWRMITDSSGFTRFQSVAHPDYLFYGQYSATGSTVKLVLTGLVSDPLSVEWKVTQLQWSIVTVSESFFTDHVRGPVGDLLLVEEPFKKGRDDRNLSPLVIPETIGAERDNLFDVETAKSIERQACFAEADRTH